MGNGPSALQQAKDSIGGGSNGGAPGAGATSGSDPYGYSLSDMSDAGTWQLSLGFATHRIDPSTGEDLDKGKPGDKITTLQQAQNAWYSMSPKQISDWAQKAYATGYIDSPKNFLAAQDQWNKMTALAASHTHFGNVAVSPADMLDFYIGANADTLKARQPGGLTKSNSQTHLSDRLQVMAMANDALQRRLGRDATPSEVSTFFNTIIAQEKAHPNVTTTTTDAKGNTSSTDSGGFGAAEIQQLLDNRAKADPEFAAKQGATTYFNAAMGALGPIGGSGA